jgi:hypothetical protein
MRGEILAQKNKEFTADKVFFINTCQVNSDGEWGANIQGIGKCPLYIFENTSSNEQMGIFLRITSSKFLLITLITFILNIYKKLQLQVLNLLRMLNLIISL